MKIQNLEFTRKRFEEILSFYGKQGLAPEFSQIRIENTLVDGQGVYRFDLKKENVGVTEQNIKRNDLFVVTHVGIFLRVDLTTKPGVAPLLTYPLLENTTAGIVGFKTKDINGLYAGKLYIATGSTVNVEDMPLSIFNRVPSAQPEIIPYVASAADSNEAAGTAKTITNTLGYKNNGVDPEFSADDAMFPLAERLAFAGTQDHKVEVSFPTFASADYASATANTSTKLVFIAYGYKVPGGTDPKFRVAENPFAASL